MYFEILQLSFACCKLMNTLTRVSLLSTYSHEQELFYKFVSKITNNLVKQLLSMTVFAKRKINFDFYVKMIYIFTFYLSTNVACNDYYFQYLIQIPWTKAYSYAK